MLEVTAAIICRAGKVLICRRPAGKRCALLWEFPGGKIERGETGEQCVVRECREELGVAVRVVRAFADVVEGDVHLHFYVAHIVSGEVQCKEHAQLLWISPEQAKAYSFCPADAKMLAQYALEAALA